MLVYLRQIAFASLTATLLAQCVQADHPVVCDHSYFGQPHGMFSTEWNMPNAAMKSLLTQSELPPASKKQYFSCPNTFAALTFTPKTGFRFVVLPHKWTDFKPKRISHTEMNQCVMNLAEIEALLDTPSVRMGSVTVRITAYAGHGVSGGPLTIDDNPTTPDDG